MKNLFLLTALAGCFLAPALRAQNGTGQSLGAFAVKTITVSTPKTPEYTTIGGEAQNKKYTLGTWVQVEVEFSSGAPAPEVSMHYSIVLAGKMLVGDQTLVEVPAGQSLFTTVFIAPRTVTTLLHGAPLTPNAIQNIDVQILRPGVSQPLANKMLRDGPAFYTTMQQVTGLVLNKAQTPFAMLWYDRYEAIKDPAAGR